MTTQEDDVVKKQVKQEDVDISNIINDTVSRDIDIGLLAEGKPLPLQQINVLASLTDLAG